MEFDLGKFVMTPRGDYNSATTYSKLDLVHYQSKTWISKVDNNTNHAPATSANYWGLVCEGTAGAQGAQGAAGTNGVNGVNGVNGAQGAQGATGTRGANGAQGATGPAGMGISVEELVVSGSDRGRVEMKPNTLFDLKGTDSMTILDIKWGVNEQYLPNPGQVRFVAIKDVTLEVTIEGGDTSTLVYRTGVEGFENGIFKQGYTYLVTILGDMIDIKSFKAK